MKVLKVDCMRYVKEDYVVLPENCKSHLSFHVIILLCGVPFMSTPVLFNYAKAFLNADFITFKCFVHYYSSQMAYCRL